MGSATYVLDVNIRGKQKMDYTALSALDPLVLGCKTVVQCLRIVNQTQSLDTYFLLIGQDRQWLYIHMLSHLGLKLKKLAVYDIQ